MIIAKYDGSFAGLLTAIFDVYERKMEQVSITKANTQPDAFATVHHVHTDTIKAERVWKGLQKKLSHDATQQFFSCYLSELEGIENTMLQYARYAFSSQQNIAADFGHPAVLTIAQTARKVWREKHRMEAFVRFQLLKGDLFYAGIEPDYNVLPLIMPHFRSRYADQNWLIYDIKRRYGIHYDKHSGQVSDVEINWNKHTQPAGIGSDILEAGEEQYQLLWKDYFKHTGIPERKNMKLHIRHIPKRYWKYLTEKL
jgi:probable DNA metabolism protein